jgi:3-oxoacyl-[acyl-carrier protein] reductase
MQETRRCAVITGSTTGIGKAIALRLLAEGYAVVLNYTHNDDHATTALTDAQAVSPHVQLVKGDVSNPDTAARLTATAVNTFGRLDVLINNAARVIDKPILDLTESDWDHVLDVNLKGAFLCAQHAARQMLTQDTGGIILNIASSTGIRGRRNGANTCASKAGLIMLTQCLALELAPKIRVNTIIPGLTETSETTSRFHLDDPQTRQTRTDAIPLARIGTPNDIANATMLLLSDNATFITGQKLVTDGGQNMW